MNKLTYYLEGHAVEMPYSEANEAIAKNEADNGVYTIVDDGQTEAAARPTIEQRLTALETAILEMIGVVMND